MPDQDFAKRYAAAWGEHGVRVTQRQNVLNLYVGGIAAVFTACAATHGGAFKGDYRESLLAGVMGFTWACSLMMMAHHRVMRHLQDFMVDLEMSEAEQSTNYRFYFSDDHGRLDSFHVLQRVLQKVIFFLLTVIAAWGACTFTFKGVDLLSFQTWTTWPTSCLSLTLLAAIVPFFVFELRFGERSSMKRRSADRPRPLRT